MKAVPFNAFTTRMMAWLLVPCAVVAAFAASPTDGLAHSKGIYQTKADAERRAAEIGCKSVHQNNGKWMPCADERELHRQLRKQ